MQLDIVSYTDLLNPTHSPTLKTVESALLQKGIIGVRNVPDFETKTRAYITAARQFSALTTTIKQQYTPNRDAGETEGYEQGAEKFKNKDGMWQVDDKKISYYAQIPNQAQNKWPREVDLKTPYLALGELIFNTGKLLLNIMGLNQELGLNHENLVGYGRMLHYRQETEAAPENADWCGSHFDHGVFTGLVPAYYFHEGKEVEEPPEAGLYIVPSEGSSFEKINAADKQILLFQVGEFGQLLSNDRIKATEHTVRKAGGGLERFTFALFYTPDDNTRVNSQSRLIADERYRNYQAADGSVTYGDWHRASLERYRVY